MPSGTSHVDLTPVLIWRGHQIRSEGRGAAFVPVPDNSSVKGGDFSDLQRRSFFPTRSGDVLPRIGQDVLPRIGQEMTS